MNYEVIFENAERMLEMQYIKSKILALEPGEDMPLGTSNLEVYRYMDGESLVLVDFVSGDDLAVLLYDDQTNSFMLEVLV